MPITGGVFTPIWQWVVDAVTHTNMDPTRFDTYGNDMATAINVARFKDGSNNPTANLPMSGFVHTGVGNATARTSYPSTGQVQDGRITNADDSGAVNAYVVTLIPALTAYANSQTFWVKIGTTNTGASTINFNGLGAKAIKTIGTTDVSAGDLTAGAVYALYYDGTNFLVSAARTGSTFVDSAFRILGSGDPTKQAAFEVDGINTGVTRTYTLQNSSGTLYQTGGSDVTIADGGTGQSTALAGFDALKQPSTTSYVGAVQLATGTEVAAASNSTKAVTPNTIGSSPAVAKAWVSFNGVTTATVLNSYGIASVTRTGAGTYQINFSNTQTDTNFAAFVSSQDTSGSWSTIIARSTASVTVGNRGTGGFADSSYITFSMFTNT